MIPNDASTAIVLSVVIPVYNEQERLPGTLREVMDYLRARPESCEIIVVDDGSTDGTASQVRRLFGEQRNLRLLSETTNHGKGYAVRRGVLAARGDYILFSDADLSAPIEEAAHLLEPLRNGYDVVIGSRALQREWIQVRQSWIRESAGKLFNLFLRALTGLPFRDTQCGFKAFRREAARQIFRLQSIDGFGFDFEALFIAKKLGCRALEVPVHWAHREGTKVRVLRDGLRMAADVLRLRWRDLRGRYPRGAATPRSSCH